MNKGRAFIEFETIDEAKNALAAHNTFLKGRDIKVSLGLNDAIISLASS